jgi:RimJ/RimL family protein N-acetyltransferase
MMSLRRILELLLHPRRLLRRRLETRLAEENSPVRNDLPLDGLPAVSLDPVDRKSPSFQELLALFGDNPSPLNASPRTVRQLDAAMDRGTRYWLVRDGEGRVMGGLGLETWRSMVVHVTVDATFRSRGLGLAMVQELHRWMRAEGYGEVRAQVLRANARALSLFLSLGYRPLERPPRRYHELVLPLDSGGD